MGLPWCLFFWSNFCCSAWFQKVFLLFWRTIFWFFLSSLFVWWCRVPILSSTYNFPSWMFWYFPDVTVLFLQLFLLVSCVLVRLGCSSSEYSSRLVYIFLASRVQKSSLSLESSLFGRKSLSYCTEFSWFWPFPLCKGFLLNSKRLHFCCLLWSIFL